MSSNKKVRLNINSIYFCTMCFFQLAGRLAAQLVSVKTDEISGILCLVIFCVFATLLSLQQHVVKK